MALGGVAIHQVAHAQVLVNLLSQNNSALVHNAYIFLNTSTNVVFSSGTGSGNFTSFLRVQNDVNEEGFNTSAGAGVPPQNPNDVPTSDTKSGVSLQPNALRANVLGDNRPGTLPANTYFVFGLDGQESVGGGGSTLSVDEVSLYYRTTQVETDPAFPDADHVPNNNDSNIALNDSRDAAKLAFIRNTGTLIWSTDYNPANSPNNHTLLVDYSNASGGNGNADIIFAIPRSLFPTNSEYIYLVARMGYTTNVLIFNTVRNFNTESSFEEFGTISNAQLIPPPPGDPVPEASTFAGGGALAAGIGYTVWCRSRREKKSAKS